LPIEIEAEIRPVFIQDDVITLGMPAKARITDVGLGGLSILTSLDDQEGSRFLVKTKVHGNKLEFFTIARHVNIVTGQSAPTYAYGMQITAAMDDVIDEFSFLMNDYIQNAPKGSRVVLRDDQDEELVERIEHSTRPETLLAK
jgi:hypothetical protein